MKKFTCNCLSGQFKNSDQVYIFDDKSAAEIPCVYRPKEKVTLRRIKLEVNYCPMCGAGLEEVKKGQ